MNTKVGDKRTCVWLEGLNDDIEHRVCGFETWPLQLPLCSLVLWSTHISPEYRPPPPPKGYIIRQPLVSPGHEWRWVTPAETWRCGLSQGWGTRICTPSISMQIGSTFNETFIFVKFHCRCHCKRRILSSWSRIDFGKQMISPLASKFPFFYGAQNFLIIFTRTYQFTLFWATWMQSTFFHCISLGSISFLTPKSKVGNSVPVDVVNFCLDWIPVT
jgi:hypothetical protein